MKKLILGLITLTSLPFIILLGAYIIHSFTSIPENAMIFACVVGGIAVLFNLVMGCMLIVSGHIEMKNFKPLD